MAIGWPQTPLPTFRLSATWQRTGIERPPSACTAGQGSRRLPGDSPPSETLPLSWGPIRGLSRLRTVAEIPSNSVCCRGVPSGPQFLFQFAGQPLGFPPIACVPLLLAIFFPLTGSTKQATAPGRCHRINLTLISWLTSNATKSRGRGIL